MSTPEKTDLSRTAEALRVYDSEKAWLEALFAAATTDEQLQVAIAETVVSEHKVREAFALDTAHVNSRDRAILVHPDDPWLRDLVAKYAARS